MTSGIQIARTIAQRRISDQSGRHQRRDVAVAGVMIVGG
jgi:hypothetical protein